MALNEGDGIVPGHGRDIARALLLIAEELGLDPHVIVRTTEGYVAPSEVLDKYNGPVTTDRIEDIPVSGPISVDTTIEGEEGIIQEAKPAHEPTDPGIFNRGTGIEDTVRGDKADEPAKNASTEDWESWAETTHGYDKAEGLSRSDIIARFSSK